MPCQIMPCYIIMMLSHVVSCTICNHGVMHSITMQSSVLYFHVVMALHTMLLSHIVYHIRRITVIACHVRYSVGHNCVSWNAMLCLSSCHCALSLIWHILFDVNVWIHWLCLFVYVFLVTEVQFPCIRAIVIRSEKLNVGTLFIITYTGGTIGRWEYEFTDCCGIGEHTVHRKSNFQFSDKSNSFLHWFCPASPCGVLANLAFFSTNRKQNWNPIIIITCWHVLSCAWF